MWQPSVARLNFTIRMENLQRLLFSKGQATPHPHLQLVASENAIQYPAEYHLETKSGVPCLFPNPHKPPAFAPG